MRNNELMEAWIRYHNKNYVKYYFESNEPRWHTKQFLLYSYRLLIRLNNDNRWTDYLSRYSDIFRRDPSNDYYGHRDPNDPDSEKAMKNSLEWANLFELNGLVGFPYNESAKKKMLKMSEKYLENSLPHLPDLLHDIMFCSAIEFMPEQFGFLSDLIFEWMDEYTSKNEVTPHQIIAYI
jgi:hypothetical protein